MAESIKKLTQDLTIGVIDINAATKCHPECFRFDGVHPDAQGAKIIAEMVYAGLTCPYSLNNFRKLTFVVTRW